MKIVIVAPEVMFFAEKKKRQESPCALIFLVGGGVYNHSESLKLGPQDGPSSLHQ
jgi:hypothetical protein